MKSVYAVLIALMFSSTAMAEAIKTYVGQDDRGEPCNLMLTFEKGKVNSIMVQATADVSGKKKPVKVWEMMLPEQFDKLIKQSGSFKSGKMYFEANESMSSPGITLKKNMGLAIDLKRGNLSYEKHDTIGGKVGRIKSNSLMSCVGLKESKEDAPPGIENDPCDIEQNADLRNMCKVEAGKKKGKVPTGAVAAPSVR